MTQLTPQELAKLHVLAQTQDEVNGWSKDRIVSLNLRDFALTCRALKSQSYGSLGERWLCERFEWDRVTGNKDYDARTPAGHHYEIKFTISGPTRTFNVVQVRPHAQIAGYIIFGINHDNTANFWHLTKNQMATECTILNAKSAHGKFDAANPVQEYRFSFKEDDETFLRWNKRYRLTVPDTW
jgi:hypothetical protein